MNSLFLSFFQWVLLRCYSGQGIGVRAMGARGQDQVSWNLHWNGEWWHASMMADSGECYCCGPALGPIFISYILCSYLKNILSTEDQLVPSEVLISWNKRCLDKGMTLDCGQWRPFWVAAVWKRGQTVDGLRTGEPHKAPLKQKDKAEMRKDWWLEWSVVSQEE